MNDLEATARPRPLRVLISTVILVALAAAGYLAIYGMPDSSADDPAVSDSSESGSDEAESSSIQAQPALPVPVLTALAERRQLVMKITATGNAEATQQLDLEFATAGEVRHINVAEGDIVNVGDEIAAVDDAELQLAVSRARESLIRAAADFSQNVAYIEDYGGEEGQELAASAQLSRIDPQHFRSLINDPRFDTLFDTLTREEVLASTDGLLARRADYDAAELNLARARLQAPFTGQVAAIEAVVGERVAAGKKLLTLVAANPIRVRVDVLESEAGLVRVGRRARVRFAAYPTQEFNGRVAAISPLVDPEKKTLEVLLELPNDSLLLKPGMFAQITLETSIYEDRLLVPADAVLLRNDRPMVFRVVNGRSDWVYITKGLENADWVEVIEGIEPGDEVIVDGHYSLAHDAVVRVVDPEVEAESQ